MDMSNIKLQRVPALKLATIVEIYCQRELIRHKNSFAYKNPAILLECWLWANIDDGRVKYVIPTNLANIDAVLGDEFVLNINGCCGVSECSRCF